MISEERRDPDLDQRWRQEAERERDIREPSPVDAGNSLHALTVTRLELEEHPPGEPLASTERTRRASSSRASWSNRTAEDRGSRAT